MKQQRQQKKNYYSILFLNVLTSRIFDNVTVKWTFCVQQSPLAIIKKKLRVQPLLLSLLLLSLLYRPTLELRRKYLCLVQLYKIFHGYSDIDYTTYEVDLTGPTRTRSNHYFKIRPRAARRNYFNKIFIF